ncbi:unnamed protein product, partial [Laminaria digitata]
MSREIMTNHIMKGAICVYRETIYIFKECLSSWVQLCAPEGAGSFVSELGLMAPVNYISALSPFIPFILSASPKLDGLPQSVCISDERLSYTMVKRDRLFMMKFRICEDVVRFRLDGGRNALKTTDKMRRSGSFVTSPVTCGSVPIAVLLNFDCPSTMMIKDLLTTPQAMDLMWRIGNALKDPPSRPSVVILWGKKGGEGKGLLLQMIARLLPGAMASVSGSPLSFKSPEMTSQEVRPLTSRRLVFMDEVNISEGINLQNLKVLTSCVPRNMSEGCNGLLSTTVLATTNRLSFTQRDMITRSAGRRMVIYEISKTIEDPQAYANRPFTSREQIMFISHCLALTETFAFPPVTVEMALTTMSRSSFRTTISSIAIERDCDERECISATYLMSVRSFLEYDALVGCAEAMNPKLVGQTDDGFRYL